MRAPIPSAIGLCIALAPASLAAPGTDWSDPAAQMVQYNAPVAKTIVELQPFRRSTTATVRDAQGQTGAATLINLNPAVNAWYLLVLNWGGSRGTRSYHLENPSPGTQLLALGGAGALEITESGRAADCAPWSREPDELERARASGLPYAPLCANKLYLRNTVPGSFSHVERVTEFLRDHVWGGDTIVNFVRETVYRDAFAESGTTSPAKEKLEEAPGAPGAAQVRAEDADVAIKPEDLGIDLETAQDLVTGAWYPVKDAPGIYLSVMRPGAVPQAILAGYRRFVNELDPVESGALDYLVAMDLQDFEVHFALGTDHPRVGWSEHMLDAERDPKLAGPDGIGSDAPLARNGMVSPSLTPRVAVAFAGGFKREHGAFRFGDLATRNHGSHFGFMQEGVIFSKLQPGLSTLYRTTDGAARMATWSSGGDAMLGQIADARQNGVPLIEADPATGNPVPGALVNQWGAGGWSGSASVQLRTVRAGACLQEKGARYLIFGYFSAATPSAMARVFQAYGCRYAMQLDINALEHTYFALYTHRNGQLVVQHLIQGMAQVDRKGGDQMAPRFLGFPDDRDFFYLLRRPAR
jgi:hypothetical protein